MNAPTSAEFARDYIRKISDMSVNPSFPEGYGRNAHAYSETESKIVNVTLYEATKILAAGGLIEGRDFRIDRDPMQNTFITVFGKDTSKTVMAGSHLDSVRNGGNHDGVDGVASALAYLRAFVQSPKADCNYTFTIFRAEESSPMTGEACLGSKVLTGTISEERLQSVTYGLVAGQRDLLSKTFGPEVWDQILDERSRPWVRNGTLYLPKNEQSGAHDMEVLGFNELHIEQSGVLMAGRYEAGIVTHIGGSTNRRFQLDASHLPVHRVETNTAPRVVWKIMFVGKEAHTGGTPHNYHADPGAHAETVYRKDALVGACHFLRAALSQANPRLCVSSVTTPIDTGFTTVPALQVLELHAPHRDRQEIETLLKRCASAVTQNYAVNWTLNSSVESNAPLNILNEVALLRLAQIPIVVEDVARQSSRKVHTLYGGNVRATTTDMHLTECGIRLNLNTRDIDPEMRDGMLQEIEERLSEAGIDTDTLFAARAAVTEYIPLDPGMAQQAQEAGAALGLRTLSMPSMPSHDAASMQKAGVPTGMVFEAHNGDSHIPTESVGEKEQANALALHHQILDRYTGRRN